MAASIPTQRLVFLVKHLVSCLQSEIKSHGVKAEIIRTLTLVLPCLSEIYGSHWEDIVEILSITWREASGGDEGLPVLESSFRLFARLKSIADDEDSNDDVKDVWSDRKTTLFNDLTSTLRRFGKYLSKVLVCFFRFCFQLTSKSYRFFDYFPSTSRCNRGSPMPFDQHHTGQALGRCKQDILSSDRSQPGSPTRCLYCSPSLYSRGSRTAIL